MHMAKYWIIGACFISLALAQDESEDYVDMTDDIRKAFLDAHNALRNSVKPDPAKPLPNLTWSDEIADAAERWASTCREGRPYGYKDHKEYLRTENFIRLGQNGDSREEGTWSPKAVVKKWADSGKSFNYNICEKDYKKRCQEKKQLHRQPCQHYLQLIWAKTTKMGCGVVRCDGGAIYRTVCDYYPAGNFPRGRLPYVPKKGVCDNKKKQAEAVTKNDNTIEKAAKQEQPKGKSENRTDDTGKKTEAKLPAKPAIVSLLDTSQNKKPKDAKCILSDNIKKANIIDWTSCCFVTFKQKSLVVNPGVDCPSMCKNCNTPETLAKWTKLNNKKFTLLIEDKSDA